MEHSSTLHLKYLATARKKKEKKKKKKKPWMTNNILDLCDRKRK